VKVLARCAVDTRLDAAWVSLMQASLVRELRLTNHITSPYLAAI